MIKWCWEREREASSCRWKRARVYPSRSQPRMFQKDSNSELTLTNVRFHGLYRWLCKDFYIEGRLVCLATDINPILYLYLTFLLTLGQVSVTFRQLPQLARILIWFDLIFIELAERLEPYTRERERERERAREREREKEREREREREREWLAVMLWEDGVVELSKKVNIGGVRC